MDIILGVLLVVGIIIGALLHQRMSALARDIDLLRTQIALGEMRRAATGTDDPTPDPTPGPARPKQPHLRVIEGGSALLAALFSGAWLREAWAAHRVATLGSATIAAAATATVVALTVVIGPGTMEREQPTLTPAPGPTSVIPQPPGQTPTPEKSKQSKRPKDPRASRTAQAAPTTVPELPAEPAPRATPPGHDRTPRAPKPKRVAPTDAHPGKGRGHGIPDTLPTRRADRTDAPERGKACARGAAKACERVS